MSIANAINEPVYTPLYISHFLLNMVVKCIAILFRIGRSGV
jgi:hypothetical protein